MLKWILAWIFGLGKVDLTETLIEPEPDDREWGMIIEPGG